MKQPYWKPHPTLAPLVRTILVLEEDQQHDSYATPIVTHGMPAMLCKIKHTSNKPASIEHLILFGNGIPEKYWKQKKGISTIAYFFHPFAMSCLFNIGAAKLKTSSLEIKKWNTAKYDILQGLIHTTKSTQEILDALDQLLLQQWKQQAPIWKIINESTDLMLMNSNKEIIASILDTMHLNERTFQRIFKKHIGITPTQFRRICQFQESFTQLRSRQFEKISDIAFDHGFADQSHFIRTFKEFTQQTPNDYLQSGLHKHKK